MKILEVADHWNCGWMTVSCIILCKYHDSVLFKSNIYYYLFVLLWCVLWYSTFVLNML